jgi:hypothetical protein
MILREPVAVHAHVQEAETATAVPESVSTAPGNWQEDLNVTAASPSGSYASASLQYIRPLSRAFSFCSPILSPHSPRIHLGDTFATASANVRCSL